MGGAEAQDVNSGSDAGVVHIQGCHLTRGSANDDAQYPSSCLGPRHVLLHGIWQG